MEAITEELALPVEDIRFIHDIFSLLAQAREYYFLPFDKSIKERITGPGKGIKGNRDKIKTNYSPFAVKLVHFRWLKTFLLHRKRGYRELDCFLTLHFLAIFFCILLKIPPKLIPRFARKPSMGIETLFK